MPYTPTLADTPKAKGSYTLGRYKNSESDENNQLQGLGFIEI